MSFEEGVTSFVCHKCNPTGPPPSRGRGRGRVRGRGRGRAPRFNALEGIPGHRPVLPPSDQGAQSPASACSPALDTGHSIDLDTQMDNVPLTTGPVTITDNGNMVYRDSDLERLMVEAEEQETESLVSWAKDVAEKATVLPSYSEFGPQFDERMNSLGFVRDPSQEQTPPNGDCALEAIVAQVRRHFNV